MVNFIEWPGNVLIVYGGNKLLPSYGRNLHILLFNDGFNRIHSVLERSGLVSFSPSVQRLQSSAMNALVVSFFSLNNLHTKTMQKL